MHKPRSKQFVPPANWFATSIIVASALLFGTSVASGPALADPREDCDQPLSGATDFDRIIAGCTQIIAQSGDDKAKLVTAYINRGLALANKSDTGKATADFSKAIDIDPNNARAYKFRGEIWRDLMIPDKAIADLDRSIALDPKDAAAYVLRGYAYDENYTLRHDTHNADGEIVDFTTAIAAAIKYVLRYKTNDADRAIADFTRAIEIDPKYANAYASRGMEYAEIGAYDRAIADYTQSIALDANHARPYSLRAKAYEALGRHEEAIADDRRARALEEQK